MEARCNICGGGGGSCNCTLSDMYNYANIGNPDPPITSTSDPRCPALTSAGRVVTCPRCSRDGYETDAYCSHCGRNMSAR